LFIGGVDMKKRIVRARHIFLNGKEVKTVVETVCAKCGAVMDGHDVEVCVVCGRKLK
jgi:hypothetical protein